jgi:hypothetical protein
MAQELIVSTADLAMIVTDLTTKANDLLAQADKAEIESHKNYETGTDYRKVVSGIKKRLEDKRKELVDPYGKRVRFINAEFKSVRDILDEADGIVKNKMLTWHNAEEKRIREENERKRKEAEEAALAAAEEAEESGDAATSEAILNMAAETPEPEDKPTIGRGELTGAASVASKVWTGKVIDMKLVCKAVAEGDLPQDLIAIPQSKLNELARKWHEENPGPEWIEHWGIRVEGETRLSVR